jgi:hypothetical protein
MTATPALTFDGRDLLVSPPSFPSEEIKHELGGRWDGSAWHVAPTSLNVLRLIEWYGIEILHGAEQDIRDLAELDWGFASFSDDERAQAREHPQWDTLYEVQREGAEYLFCNPHGTGLLGLSWGLGKAATSIVAADLLDAQRVLVLAPLTLAPAWIDEWNTWGVGAASGVRNVKRATKDDRTPGTSGVTIANHEVIQEVVLRDEDGNVIQPEWVTNARRVKQWIADGPTKKNANGKTVPVRERIVRVRRDYLDAQWDLIICDESVMLKNRKAVKANVLLSLRKKHDPFLWLLSASPKTKYNDDLHKQLEIMYPRAFKSYWRTAEFFTHVDKSGWGWSIEGDRLDRDPQHYLRDLLWMKSEDDAGVDLPEYIESAMPVEATAQQRAALDTMLEDWIVELEEAEEPVVADNWLARSTRLQQITSNLGALPKPNGKGFFKPNSAKEELLIDLLERDDLKPPLLVWTWFIETTGLLAERLEKHGLHVEAVVGTDTTKHKDSALGAFKTADLDALVLQMGVGKFGHTFTKTRSIYYHDRTFDSDAYVQSRRRVRRIGLEHRPTLIVPKIRESADELIDANLEGKLRSIARLSNANLADLLRSLRSQT